MKIIKNYKIGANFYGFGYRKPYILCWKNRIFIFDFLFVLFCDEWCNKLHSHCVFCEHVSLVFIANAWANCNYYFMYFRIHSFDRWIKLHMVELIQCNIFSFVREEKKYILSIKPATIVDSKNVCIFQRVYTFLISLFSFCSGKTVWLSL